MHDIEALTHALEVPCSPEAASCILLNAHAACKLGQGNHLTKRDLTKHEPDRKDTIIHVKVALSLPSASASKHSCICHVSEASAYLCCLARARERFLKASKGCPGRAMRSKQSSISNVGLN